MLRGTHPQVLTPGTNRKDHRPTYEVKALVGDEQALAEVRWVDLAQADELMSRAIFEPVLTYLQKTLACFDLPNPGVDRR